MASNFSWDVFQSDRLIKRRYLQIPLDQQNLLDDESAWSETLRRGHPAMLNLPSQVITDVKGFHARKNAALVQKHTSPAPRPSSSRSAKPVQPASSPVRKEEEEDAESDGTPIPWSQSQCAGDEEDLVDAPVQHEAPALSHKDRPASLPPRTQSKRQEVLVFEDEPPTSTANSEGLEIEPPGFLSQEMEPSVNRAALGVITIALSKPEPTPPSAQLPVNTGDSAIQPPPAKRRRRMEDIRLSGQDLGLTEPTIALKATPKPATANLDTKQDSDNMSAASSSEAQPTREKPTQPGSPKATSGPAPCPQLSSFTPTWEGRRQGTRERQALVLATPTSRPSFAPPPAQKSPTDQSVIPSTRPSARLTQGGAALSPYEEFRAAYPDYSENSRKFVSACLSVNQLRRDRQLPEFLYDDFVRAYSSDYLLYVSECSRKKAEKLLPGIQWYNDHVKRAQYMKGLIRKDNLAAILEAHAEEAHSVRRALGDSQSTASNSAAEESDEDMADAIDEDGQEENEPEVIEIEDDGSQASSELHMESPSPPPARNLLGLVHAESIAKTRALLQEHTISLAADDDIQMDEQTEDTVAEHTRSNAADREMADIVEHAPISQTASLGAVRQRATPNGSGAPSMRNTPKSGKSAGPQTNSRALQDSVGPSDSLKPVGSSPPTRSPSSRGRNHYRVVEAVASSPPQRATRPSSAHTPRNVSVGEDGEEEEKEEEEEEEDAFDPPMPPPPPKQVARSSPAPKIRSVSTGTVAPASTATAPGISGSVLPTQRRITEPVTRRTSNASSFATGRNHSPASSERSYANVPRSKKRLGETPRERSRNLKAFMKKRLSTGTPTSTLASRP